MISLDEDFFGWVKNADVIFVRHLLGCAGVLIRTNNRLYAAHLTPGDTDVEIHLCLGLLNSWINEIDDAIQAVIIVMNQEDWLKRNKVGPVYKGKDNFVFWFRALFNYGGAVSFVDSTGLVKPGGIDVKFTNGLVSYRRTPNDDDKNYHRQPQFNLNIRRIATVRPTNILPYSDILEPDEDHQPKYSNNNDPYNELFGNVQLLINPEEG